MSGSPYVLKLHDCNQPEKTVYRVEMRDGERFDTIEVEPFSPEGQIEWLWPGRVALGKVTVIGGGPGSGKSRLAFDLAARVGGALPWPDGTPSRLPAADVLVISRHEEAGSALDRFREPGESPRQLLRFRGFWTEAPDADQYAERPVAFPFDLEALEFYLENHPAVGMVLIDPLSDFCATPKLLAETLHQLQGLAGRSNVAVVVTVPATCRTDAQGGLRVTSRWPTEAARCVWCIVPDPVDPSRRLFVANRTNFCREPHGLAFRLDDRGMAWEADSSISPVDPLGQLSGCEQFLTELLSVRPQPSTMVYRLGAERGFTAKELRAAGTRLGASKGRVGFSGAGHWEWSLAGEWSPLIGADGRIIGEATLDSPLPHADIGLSTSRQNAMDDLLPLPFVGEGRGGGASMEAASRDLPEAEVAPAPAGVAPDAGRPFRAVNGGPEGPPCRNHPALPGAGPATRARPLSKRKARRARRRLARENAAQLRKTPAPLAGAGSDRFATVGCADAGSAL